MLGTGNFPDFFGKNPVPRKWHLGMQTSTLGALVNYQFFYIDLMLGPRPIYLLVPLYFHCTSKMLLKLTKMSGRSPI